MFKKLFKKNTKNNNNTHCRAIKAPKVVLLFVGKNGFWKIEKANVFLILWGDFEIIQS